MNSQTSENSNLTQDITSIPEYSNKQKRTRILISVLVLSAIFCIGTFAFLTIFRSPKAAVLKAVKNTLTNVDTTAQDYLPIKELRAILADGHYQSTCNLALEDYTFEHIQNTNYRDFLALAPSVSFKTRVDYPDKKADSAIDFICAGSTILNANAYALDDTFGLECPALYDGCLSFNTTTLAEDYNQSYLCTLLKNKMLDQNINFNLFSTPYSDKNFLELYNEYYTADNKALYEAMTVKKVNGDTIQVGKKSVSAKGYEITIPREHIEKAIGNLFYLSVHESESAYEELRYLLEQHLGTIDLPEDFVCTVYVDPKSDTMVKCVHTSEYLLDGISSTVTASIDWTGEKHPSDIIRSVITMKDTNGLQRSIICNSTSQTKENIYEKSYTASMHTIDNSSSDKVVDAAMNYSINTNNGALTFHSDANKDKNTLMNLDITGSLTSINAGKGIFLDIDHADFASSYFSASLSLTGDYTFETLQTEVSAPTETLRPVLEMSEDDFYGFVYEAIRNFYSSTLGSLIHN